MIRRYLTGHSTLIRLLLAAALAVGITHRISSAETTPVRTLHFPTDQTLGLLEDLNQLKHPPKPYEPATWLQCMIEKGTDLGQATGDTTVPASARVLLRIPLKHTGIDLSPLNRLKPNDLYSVRFPSDWTTSGKQLASVAGVTGLREITGLRAEDHELIRLKRMTSLERLDVSCQELDTSGIDCIASVQSLTALRLHAGSTITLEQLSRLSALKNLRSLDLHIHKLEPGAYACLSRFPALEMLHIGTSECSGEGFEHLPGISGLRHLGFYDLNGKGFAALPAMPQLTQLDISYTGAAITADQLASLSRLPALEYLKIRGRVLDDGIAQLKQLPNLRSLFHQGNFQDRDWITDKALEHIGSLRALEHLSLYTGEFTDIGLQHLSGLKALKTLEIPNSSTFTDTGLESVAGMTGLEEIYLCGKLITDDGISRLGNLHNLKSLRFFPNSNVTSDGIAKLRSKLPNLSHVEPQRLRL